jgi:hypothetical protein
MQVLSQSVAELRLIIYTRYTTLYSCSCLFSHSLVLTPPSYNVQCFVFLKDLQIFYLFKSVVNVLPDHQTKEVH